MNVHMLANDAALEKPILKLLSEKGALFYSTSNIEQLYMNCLKHPASIFFVQANVQTEITILDVIRDIRVYFGAFPLIIVIGRKISILNPTNFLEMGADDVLIFPYDIVIFEDFLSNSLKRDNFLPINFRNVPSGGSNITIIRSIKIREINSNGIIFKSTDLIARGTIISVGISQFLDVSSTHCRFKIISSESVNDCQFLYSAAYYEVSNDIKRQILFQLKKSN